MLIIENRTNSFQESLPIKYGKMQLAFEQMDLINFKLNIAGNITNSSEVVTKLGPTELFCVVREMETWMTNEFYSSYFMYQVKSVS